MNLKPAEYIIQKFGGVQATARALDMDASAISKWKKRGGGFIPSQAQQKILKVSKKLNLGIQPQHLVEGINIKI